MSKLLVALSLVACASHVVPVDPEQPRPCRNQLYEHAAIDPAMRVVACDLPPGSQLFAVVDDVAYTRSARSTLIADDLTDGVRTSLYPSLGDDPSFFGGRIYFEA